MENELTFESAEKQLQEIALKLEDENLPFSEAQKLYEKGSELVKFCLSSLDEVKGKITIIKKELDQFIEEKFE
ncbi:MAG: exodeoxyribonuclease VII small subunit [Firmicutes bacterium]|jgi:exodeoxyribonuclease VII small subunit|nr:exodeoxyribonuclease VII small subunit [Bacillota bacterium]MDY5585780.1 exodeoxyribonuclease VII small subunit [Eubacteriales bacterium]